MVYAIVNEKAFQIPAMMKITKVLLRLRSEERCRNLEWKLMMKQQVRSIQVMGVKVGEFHMLERMSTPAFVHYAIIHVASMLVAYK